MQNLASIKWMKMLFGFKDEIIRKILGNFGKNIHNKNIRKDIWKFFLERDTFCATLGVKCLKIDK